MEIIFGAIISASLAYLISEVGDVQKEVKTLLIKLAVLEARFKNQDDDAT